MPADGIQGKRVLPRPRGRCRHRDGQAAPTLTLVLTASGARATCFRVCFYFFAGVAFGLLACARVNDSSRASDSTRMTCKRHRSLFREETVAQSAAFSNPSETSQCFEPAFSQGKPESRGWKHAQFLVSAPGAYMCYNGFLDGATIRCGLRESSTSFWAQLTNRRVESAQRSRTLRNSTFNWPFSRFSLGRGAAL